VPDDLAAIVYTSGSTGMPKGIVITHQIFHDATVHSAAILRNTSEDRLISVTPLSFDGALSQLFTATFVGGTLVQQQSVLPGDVVKTLQVERVTGVHAMPSFWRTLLHPRSPFPQQSFPSLRYVSIIGEAMPQKMLARLRAILPACQVCMMYGTTEAFRSTYLPPQDLDRKRGSAGVPFPGVSISIVQEDGTRCPPGEVGMIVHQGSYVSPGYWNDPPLTAATFRDKGLYTGDLGKVDEEGYLYVVGRNDELIKTMGFRVSPEEVENCLSELEGVSEAVVVAVTDPDGATTLKAIVVCDGNSPLSTNAVRRHCRDRLPHYMVPASVEFRDALPKTPSNKISRAAVH
jgi:acyl-CoA synthetase (AMP-forming)/AMP-acid ligase II